MLFPLVAREVVLRLLQTEQAPRITAALDGSGTSVVAAATALLNGRMAEPWSMERLARELRVSESTLFARFKEATGMTPAQYLKRTRLGEARRLMVVHGDAAARAASVVGFRSASHFSRAYREAYGRPPAADAVAARAQLALATAVSLWRRDGSDWRRGAGWCRASSPEDGASGGRAPALRSPEGRTRQEGAGRTRGGGGEGQGDRGSLDDGGDGQSRGEPDGGRQEARDDDGGYQAERVVEDHGECVDPGGDRSADQESGRDREERHEDQEGGVGRPPVVLRDDRLVDGRVGDPGDADDAEGLECADDAADQHDDGPRPPARCVVELSVHVSPCADPRVRSWVVAVSVVGHGVRGGGPSTR